jgi:mRNA-degrading endonuclease RelE of RelBE toxin-antitoxin system
MITVRWDPPAVCDMRKLDPPIARQIHAAINHYAATRQGDVTRLRPPLVGCRLRSGNWRVRFRFDGPDLIHVEHVVHRSQAYR